MLRPVNRFVISTSTEVPLWNLQPSQMSPRKIFHLKLRSGTFTLGKCTLVMGVLNVTPDSFSDGGKFFDAKRAVQHALAMQSDGADIVDVGAESTRPGSQEISVAEELSRLLPVLEQLRGKLKIPISVDTQKATVAEMALGAGAEIVNDISGLRTDPELARIVARRGAALILMHMRGTPRTMQKGPFARDVMRDVIGGLKQSIATAKKYGVPSSQMVIDPGIGFGKNYAQNYELLAKLPKLATLGYPLMVGTSRKGFLGATLAKNGKPAPAEERIWGTAATVAASILNGAHIVRVHDVAEMKQIAVVADCVVRPELLQKNERN
jgi:dihydropteroate synthase